MNKKVLVGVAVFALFFVLYNFSFAEDAEGPVVAPEVATTPSGEAVGPIMDEQKPPETAIDIQDDIMKKQTELEGLHKEHRELIRKHDVKGAEALHETIVSAQKALMERRKELNEKIEEEKQ